MTVTEIELRMPARELVDWHRYWQQEPWGSVRDNMHTGLICSNLLAPHVRRGKKPPGMGEFMLMDAAAAQQKRRAGTSRALQALKAMAKPGKRK